MAPSCCVALTHPGDVALTNQGDVFWLGDPTCQKANPPEPRVQRELDLGRLVLGLDDALLQVEPVVSADGDAQEAEAADGKHAAEQGQRLPAAGAHRHQHRELCPGLLSCKEALE